MYVQLCSIIEFIAQMPICYMLDQIHMLVKEGHSAIYRKFDVCSNPKATGSRIMCTNVPDLLCTLPAVGVVA